jgi:hypothetical protein
MRAMSVPVDEVSDIAGFVLPHTRVDVLVAVPGNGPEGKPFSKIVLQNVEVLAVAQEIEHTHDQPQVVKVVTLMVTPQEAERLALASREGSLHLAMRSYDDHKIVMTTGVSIPEMLHSYSDAPPPMVVSIQHGHVVRQPAARVRPIQIQIMRDGKSAESVSFVRQPSPERASAGYWIAHSSSGERNHPGNGAPATLPDPVEAKAPAFVGSAVPAGSPAILDHTRTNADSGAASSLFGDSGLSAPTPKTIDVP